MNHFDLLFFSTPAELAQAAASAWLDEVAPANRVGKPHYVALSGGRIACYFLAAAAELAQKRAVSPASVHFFWSDERCVPPTDPESNFQIADELLLKPFGILPDKIHRILGEQPPEMAVEIAIAEIKRVVPLDKAGQPVFDLVFLGMGEDGHVASLFSGEPEAVMSSKAIYRAVTATKPPPRRITLGYDTIAAARQVWVLASGTGKEEALHESLRVSGQTPLARVIRSRNHTRIFTDIRTS